MSDKNDRVIKTQSDDKNLQVKQAGLYLKKKKAMHTIM
jgi:hypothetical protein